MTLLKNTRTYEDSYGNKVRLSEYLNGHPNAPQVIRLSVGDTGEAVKIDKILANKIVNYLLEFMIGDKA